MVEGIDGGCLEDDMSMELRRGTEDNINILKFLAWENFCHSKIRNSKRETIRRSRLFSLEPAYLEVDFMVSMRCPGKQL